MMVRYDDRLRPKHLTPDEYLVLLERGELAEHLVKHHLETVHGLGVFSNPDNTGWWDLLVGGRRYIQVKDTSPKTGNWTVTRHVLARYREMQHHLTFATWHPRLDRPMFRNAPAALAYLDTKQWMPGAVA